MSLICSTSHHGTLAVFVSAFGFGLSPYLGTRTFAAGVDPAAASLLRILLLAVVLSPWAGRLLAWPRESVIVAAAGAASMLGFAGFFISLDRAPIAAATIVYYTYPAVVLALSAAYWKRRLRLADLGVCGLILGGVALSVGPVAMSGAVVVALLPAVAAPIGWATFLLVLSGPAASMPTMPKMFAGACGGTVALIPLALWRTGGQLMPLTTSAFSAVAVMTLCTLAIPALLVTWGAPRTGERATAMIGSLEFIVALSVSWLLTEAVATRSQVGGVVLIVLGAMVGIRQTPHVDGGLPTSLDQPTRSPVLAPAR